MKKIILIIILFIQIIFGEIIINKLLDDVFKEKNNSSEKSKLKDDFIDLGKSHRYNLNEKNIKFEENRIIIEVNCRRTNIQTTLIKSYWMIGYALSKNNLIYPEIIVILNVSKRNNTIITLANGTDVVALGKHEINDYNFSKQFLKNLTIYKKNNE